MWRGLNIESRTFILVLIYIFQIKSNFHFFVQNITKDKFINNLRKLCKKAQRVNNYLLFSWNTVFPYTHNDYIAEKSQDKKREVILKWENNALREVNLKIKQSCQKMLSCLKVITTKLNIVVRNWLQQHIKYSIDKKLKWCYLQPSNVSNKYKFVLFKIILRFWVNRLPN